MPAGLITMETIEQHFNKNHEIGDFVTLVDDNGKKWKVSVSEFACEINDRCMWVFVFTWFVPYKQISPKNLWYNHPAHTFDIPYTSLTAHLFKVSHNKHYSRPFLVGFCFCNSSYLRTVERYIIGLLKIEPQKIRYDGERAGYHFWRIDI